MENPKNGGGQSVLKSGDIPPEKQRFSPVKWHLKPESPASQPG